MRPSLLVLLCVSVTAWAQGGTREVEIVVGKTAQVNVGEAAGLNCDDLTIVQPKLVTSKDKTHNTLVLKGLAAGDTYCRAGTGMGRTVLVHIVVNDPPI
ncbi:MAG: hypothetical protein ACXWLF_08050 [Myxococcaceae bacterium]